MNIKPIYEGLIYGTFAFVFSIVMFMISPHLYDALMIITFLELAVPVSFLIFMVTWGMASYTLENGIFWKELYSIEQDIRSTVTRDELLILNDRMNVIKYNVDSVLRRCEWDGVGSKITKRWLEVD